MIDRTFVCKWKGQGTWNWIHSDIRVGHNNSTNWWWMSRDECQECWTTSTRVTHTCQSIIVDNGRIVVQRRIIIIIDIHPLKRLIKIGSLIEQSHAMCKQNCKLFPSSVARSSPRFDIIAWASRWHRTAFTFGNLFLFSIAKSNFACVNELPSKESENLIKNRNEYKRRENCLLPL